MKLRFNATLSSAQNISILLLTFIIACTQTMAQAVEAKPVLQPVSQSERQAFEKIIREYLLKNPTVVRDALQELQVREEKEKLEQIDKNLTNLKSELYADVNSPVAGNKNDDVPIVVFYDYFCGYCRKTLPELEKLLAKNSSIRVIYKELPILGPQSFLAARAALAADRQGKFSEFHLALLRVDGNLDMAAIIGIGKQFGLNIDVLEKDMRDPKLNEAIERSSRLATALNINGTPAYVVGRQIIPGAIDTDSLERLVINQRSSLRLETKRITPAGSK